MKKIVICIIILIILSSASLGMFFLKSHSTEIENKKPPKEEVTLTKTQLINGIKFTNIECNYNGYDYLIEYTIINTTNERINLTEYELIIKDKNNEVLANISPSLEISLAPNESYHTGNSINIDLSAADSIEIITE